MVNQVISLSKDNVVSNASAELLSENFCNWLRTIKAEVDNYSTELKLLRNSIRHLGSVYKAQVAKQDSNLSARQLILNMGYQAQKGFITIQNGIEMYYKQALVYYHSLREQMTGEKITYTVYVELAAKTGASTWRKLENIPYEQIINAASPNFINNSFKSYEQEFNILKSNLSVSYNSFMSEIKELMWRLESENIVESDVSKRIKYLQSKAKQFTKITNIAVNQGNIAEVAENLAQKKVKRKNIQEAFSSVIDNYLSGLYGGDVDNIQVKALTLKGKSFQITNLNEITLVFNRLSTNINKLLLAPKDKQRERLKKLLSVFFSRSFASIDQYLNNKLENLIDSYILKK